MWVFSPEMQQSQNSKKAGIKSVQTTPKLALDVTQQQSIIDVKNSQPVGPTVTTAPQSQSDSGGDDSSKENKENSADESQQTPKAKKGRNRLFLF